MCNAARHRAAETTDFARFVRLISWVVCQSQRRIIYVWMLADARILNACVLELFRSTWCCLVLVGGGGGLWLPGHPWGILFEVARWRLCPCSIPSQSSSSASVTHQHTSAELSHSHAHRANMYTQYAMGNGLGGGRNSQPAPTPCSYNVYVSPAGSESRKHVRKRFHVLGRRVHHTHNALNTVDDS